MSAFTFFAALLCGAAPVHQDDFDKLIGRLGNSSTLVRKAAARELEEKMDFELYVRLRTRVVSENALREKAIKDLMRRYREKRVEEYFSTINLQGYPEFPWIDQGLPVGWQWQNHSRMEIVAVYRAKAHAKGAKVDYCPAWSDYRVATQLWLKDRLAEKVGELSLIICSEEAFGMEMSQEMEDIAQDLACLIAGEEQWWIDRCQDNPIRRKVKK